MKDVKLHIVDGTVGITQLVNAVAVTSGHGIPVVMNMMEQDGLLPTVGSPELSLQRCYWREDDWFDDALRYLMVYNMLSKVRVVKDK